MFSDDASTTTLMTAGTKVTTSGDSTAMRNVTQSDSNDLDQREMITVGNIRANQVVESVANVERH